jgi:Zn finger protein HypA/HybF involved in hydrogenase expression
MHEVALVNTAAAGLIAEADGRQVSNVVLAIGPKVERDVAESTWITAVEGTSVEHALLEIVDVLDVLRCLDCGNEYPGMHLTQCPKCGGSGLVVGEAEEVSVASWTA